MNKLLYFALALTLLLTMATAEGSTGFEDLSLVVTVTVNEDGTAHVSEDLNLLVSQGSIDLYKDSLKSTRLTIDDWKKITGASNLRYHVLGDNAKPINLRLYPKPLRYFQYVNTSLATITMEYDTNTPIFDLVEAGPRKTNYVLKTDVFSFENAPEGQILSEDAALRIEIPANSFVDLGQTFPRPSYPYGTGKAYEREYVWNATGGAIPITPFDFTFTLEKSLDEEVSEFFTEMQGQILATIFSNYGLLVIVLVAVFVSLFMVLKKSDLL